MSGKDSGENVNNGPEEPVWEDSARRGRLQKMSKALRLPLLIVFSGIFIFSAVKLIQYYYQAGRAMSGIDQLRETLGEVTPRPSPATTSTPPGGLQPSPTEQVWEIQSKFEELYTQNGDFVGWVHIPGTRIDYPVMRSSEENPEYYLYRNFEKKYDESGIPFMDSRCGIQPNSEHLLIYGHNMNSGIMFHHLLEYEKKDFWSEHQYICFDTLFLEGTYRIFAVFKFDLTSSDREGFQFHRYVDFESEELFDEFVAEVRDRGLYDTGITAEYGDELLTLATCEYSTWDSRMVIVAKKVG